MLIRSEKTGWKNINVIWIENKKKYYSTTTSQNFFILLLFYFIYYLQPNYLII